MRLCSHELLLDCGTNAAETLTENWNLDLLVENSTQLLLMETEQLHFGLEIVEIIFFNILSFG